MARVEIVYNMALFQILGPTKKKPLKTFQEYSKMSGFDTELSLDLKGSLDETDGVRDT